MCDCVQLVSLVEPQRSQLGERVSFHSGCRSPLEHVTHDKRPAISVQGLTEGLNRNDISEDNVEIRILLVEVCLTSLRASAAAEETAAWRRPLERGLRWSRSTAACFAWTTFLGRSGRSIRKRCLPSSPSASNSWAFLPKTRLPPTGSRRFVRRRTSIYRRTHPATAKEDNDPASPPPPGEDE